MPTLWEAVTGNSTLPNDPSNTFWDHLNNPVPQDPPIFYGDLEIGLQTDTIAVELDSSAITVILEEE